MSVPTHPVSIDQFGDDVRGIIAGLTESDPPVVINDGGRGVAVLFSMAAYEKAEYERELLRRVARGRREAEEGQSRDLEDVMRDADALLASDPT